MKSPRVSRRLKSYLKENVFESTHDLVPRLYDFAIILIQSNTTGKGLIINFGCGPFPVELNARLIHLNEGFSTRFLNIDISRKACTRHKKAMDEMVEKHKNQFLNDVYLNVDIERVKVQVIRKALNGAEPQGGLAISFLEYYSPKRAVKFITRMLKHCDSLVCSVRIDPEFEKTFDTENRLNLHFFKDLSELKTNLVHEDWEIKEIIGVPRFNDGERGIFLMLIKRNQGSPE